MFSGRAVSTNLTSIVIVNYNGARYLRECLRALRDQSLPAHRFEVIVVDNDSHDGSVELLRTDFPWVRVVPMRTNLGFAAGNNAGFLHAHGDHIVLLNNDTAADPHFLTELLASAAGAPAVGGVAAKLVFHADPRTLNSAGSRLLPDGHAQDRGFRDADIGQFETDEEVFSGCGAALLLRKDMLDEAGAFDERYFMYYEDTDLAWRAHHRGWSFRYAPRSLVRHIHCGSSGEWSPFFTFHVERNRVLTSIKNGDLITATWTVFSLFSRLRKSAVRLAAGGSAIKQRWAILRAYLLAVVSLTVLLPAFLLERYRVRTSHRPRGV
jgi:GT2 family glycosyltransferase